MYRQLTRTEFCSTGRGILRTQIYGAKKLQSCNSFVLSSTYRQSLSFSACASSLRIKVPVPRAPIWITRRSLSSSPAPSSATTKARDLFLDNLGKLFLSAIGILLLSLVRSSMGTSNKSSLREEIEHFTSLDPFEIEDLRVANDQLTPGVFREICKRLQNEHGWSANDEVDYKSFVKEVMKVMKDVKGDSFTIELGFLIDRVVAAMLEDGNMFGVVDEQGRITYNLLLVVLSLAINGSPRERIEILYDILKKDKTWSEEGESDSTSPGISEKDVVDMVGYLQKSSQLVPDAQIIESTKKYPIQEYVVASPLEMVVMGKATRKEFLSDDALREDGEGKWSCDDFHHLLRSRSVCAWGECYVKKKSLT